jgi:hypothetical protein
VTVAPAHIPAAERHLPADYYGRFDIKNTADGGKQYSLPHTLGATVLAVTTGRKTLLAVLGLAVVCAFVFPAREPHSPLADTWVYSALVFFPLHALVAFTVALIALITGMRKLTRITIREDGLIWNDRNFFPASHIWMVSFGNTSNKGTPDEEIHSKLEIQVGTQMITLADGLEKAPAQLFERLFTDDTRRYWHRHN